MGYTLFCQEDNLGTNLIFSWPPPSPYYNTYHLNASGYNNVGISLNILNGYVRNGPKALYHLTLSNNPTVTQELSFPSTSWQIMKEGTYSITCDAWIMMPDGSKNHQETAYTSFTVIDEQLTPIPQNITLTSSVTSGNGKNKITWSLVAL